MEIVRQLWPYLDDALPDEMRERVVSHLEACDGCRSHFDFERAFLEAVREAANGDAGLGALQSRVLAALSSEGFLLPP